jgi:hypothetical protein
MAEGQLPDVNPRKESGCKRRAEDKPAEGVEKSCRQKITRFSDNPSQNKVQREYPEGPVFISQGSNYY